MPLDEGRKQKECVPEKEQKFEKEVGLCAAFIAALPKEWTAYPETGGFDILLVRKEDGFQIGVEAKLKLNGKVIIQAAERPDSWSVTHSGPDCRAVLMPDYASADLSGVCRLLGITCIRMRCTTDSWRPFYPYLPEPKDRYDHADWHECCPHRRLDVPDWVPDVGAGNSSPIMLTFWKIAAIKLAIILDRRGFLRREDFKKFNVSMSRWTQGKWLVQNGSGGWIRGDYFPDFKRQHPVNYQQIEADYDKWMPESELV